MHNAVVMNFGCCGSFNYGLMFNGLIGFPVTVPSSLLATAPHGRKSDSAQCYESQGAGTELKHLGIGHT
jgi:hypothetical protein